MIYMSNITLHVIIPNYLLELKEKLCESSQFFKLSSFCQMYPILIYHALETM